MNTKRAWLAAAAFLTAGFIGCDAVVSVKGELVSATGAPLERCTATLFRAESDQELEVIDIGTTFDDTFTTLPARTEFYVEVACRGHSTQRTPPFYSSGVLGDPPANLGKITLAPLPGEEETQVSPP